MGKHGSKKHHHPERDAKAVEPPPPPVALEPYVAEGGSEGEAGGGRLGLAAATAIAAVLATLAGTVLQYGLAQQYRSDTRQTQQSAYAQISLALVGGPPKITSPFVMTVRAENDTSGETVARGCHLADKEIGFPLPTFTPSGTEASPRGVLLSAHLNYAADPDPTSFDLDPGDKKVFSVSFPPALEGTTRITMSVSCVSHNTDASKATLALGVIVLDHHVLQVQLPQSVAVQT